MDRRDQTLQNREQLLDDKENNLTIKQKEIQERQMELEEAKNEQLKQLEKIAGYTKEKAKKEIMKKVEDMMNLEVTSYIKDREAEARLEADKKSKELLVSTMQRYAADENLKHLIQKA